MFDAKTLHLPSSDSIITTIRSNTIDDPLWFRTCLELYRLGFGTLIITILLDLICWRDVLKVWKWNYSLYLKSIVMNFFNNLIIAPLVFVFLIKFLLMEMQGCSRPENLSVLKHDLRPENLWTYKWWLRPDLSDAWCDKHIQPESKRMFINNPEQIIRTLGVLLIQSLGYWYCHKMMHRREYYWMHRFHHQYSTLVVPMTANAVHVTEYTFAYMAPIFIGTIIAFPNLKGLFIAGWIISMTNLLIHTPFLHDLSESNWFPDWLVSTCGHFEHHKLLHCHYAAPTFNVDWFYTKFVRGREYRRGGTRSSGGGEEYEQDKKRFDEMDKKMA